MSYKDGSTSADPVMTVIGGQDGTTLRPVRLDASGNLSAPSATVAFDPGSAATVGVASGEIVEANTVRLELIVCNDHATNVVYLKLGENEDVSAELNKGIRLGPGDPYVTTIWKGAVQAIASGASTNVTITEV